MQPVVRSSSAYWDYWQPVVERALTANSTHEPEDVYHGIRRGWHFFFAEGVSFMVVDILNHPQVTTGQVWLAAGDLDELKAMAPKVEVWAKEQGCTRFEVAGRKGWEGALKDMGFRHHTTVLVKDITDG
jgi:hypothetical protein